MTKLTRNDLISLHTAISEAVSWQQRDPEHREAIIRLEQSAWMIDLNSNNSHHRYIYKNHFYPGDISGPDQSTPAAATNSSRG